MYHKRIRGGVPRSKERSVGQHQSPVAVYLEKVGIGRVEDLILERLKG